MAYPTVKLAYGLQPASLIGGQVFSGATRMFPISSTTGNLFNGDLVKLNAVGSVIPVANVIPTSTTAGQAAEPGTIGVFLGAEYATTGGPLFGKMRNNYWSTAFSSAQDAVGYIVHDPDTVFKAAVYAQVAGGSNSSAALTTIGYMSPSFVGSNVYYTQANQVLGSASNGNSNAGVCANSPAGATAGNVRLAGTTAAPFRIMDVVPETAVTFSTTVTTGSTVTTSTSAVTDTVYTVGSTANIVPGMQAIITPASGPAPVFGLSQNATVISVSSTQVTIRSPITPTVTTQVVPNGAVVSFVGYPEVLVKLNFGYHSYYNGSGV